VAFDMELMFWAHHVVVVVMSTALSFAAPVRREPHLVDMMQGGEQGRPCPQACSWQDQWLIATFVGGTMEVRACWWRCRGPQPASPRPGPLVTTSSL
jgi:hypothetical protein